MESENTEVTGAVPADKTVGADSSAAAEKDVKTDSSTKEEPWHKDPRFKNELGLLKAAKGLMEKNGLESVEDLIELAESGKKIKGKESDIDRLDEIKQKAAKLDKYESYWKDQEERQRRQQEDPEQTIARLEKQLKEREAHEKHKEQTKLEQEAAKNALKAYDSEVNRLIKEIDVPKEQADFVLKFFGVSNQFNEIDITDKKAIRKMVEDGKRELDDFKQKVIQDYIKGKDGIVKVGNASPAAPTKDGPKIMLKDARKALHEAMQRVVGG